MGVGHGTGARPGTNAGPGTLLLLDKETHPTRKGGVVLVIEKASRHTLFVDELLNAGILQGKGILLVLCVFLDIQQTEIPLSLSIPHPMAGMAVPLDTF